MSRKKNVAVSSRLSLRVTPSIRAYLDDLVKIGVHGKTQHEVANHLISREIERLLIEKFLDRGRDGES